MTEAGSPQPHGEIDFDGACALVRSATNHPRTPEAVRRAIRALRGGNRRDQAAAYGALEAFIVARLRPRRLAASDEEEIASDLIGKLLASPQLFIEAENPAAYLSIAIKHRFLSFVRATARRARREQREAAKVESVVEDDEDLDAIKRARDALEAAAARALEKGSQAELRAQRSETWGELWDLYERKRSMDQIIDEHLSRDAGARELATRDPEKADKLVRDRLLQRHQRMRRLVGETIESLVNGGEWPGERGREATEALRNLLVRCHKKPAAKAVGGVDG